MRILMVTDHTYPPQSVGGSESSTHELAISLGTAGHEVAVMANIESGGWVFNLNRVKSKLLRRAFPSDTVMGYRVYRGWLHEASFPAGVREVQSSFQADVVMCQAGRPLKWAMAAASAGLTVFVYIRDVEFHDLGGDPRLVRGVRYLANSAFTAARFAAAFGIASTVVYPLVIRERYLVQSSNEVVLFVNPHPAKGVAIALALARLRPDIRFMFQLSWKLSAANLEDLRRELSALSNVELRPPCLDMREAYRRTRVLLAPSQWEEAWGRVVSEAQVSGIPALVSNRGGLPEALGGGGIMLAHDAGIDEWVGALALLWDQPDRWQEYSAKAGASAARPQLQPQQLIRQIEEQLRHSRDDSRGSTA